MAGFGYQEIFIVIYLLFLGGIIYLGYRAVRWFFRREQQSRAIDDDELVARVKREVLAELAAERTSQTGAGTSAQPVDGESSSSGRPPRP
jgi:hypothetical protein